MKTYYYVDSVITLITQADDPTHAAMIMNHNLRQQRIPIRVSAEQIGIYTGDTILAKHIKQ